MRLDATGASPPYADTAGEAFDLHRCHEPVTPHKRRYHPTAAKAESESGGFARVSAARGLRTRVLHRARLVPSSRRVGLHVQGCLLRGYHVWVFVFYLV